jgi:hypothetical protein
MGLLFVIAAGALVYAWYSGKLKGFTYEDGIAAGVFLLGLRFLTTGKLLPGAVLMAGAIGWAAWRRGARGTATPPMPLEDARALLGVRPDASLAEIRDAHRRLIARVHPDAGGSAELAHRVNAARDTLVRELNRRTPRAS